jgi:light-regulated signal transduction histidine kinase (bacteriophytochrome)
VNEGVHRMERLIRDLLAYARVIHQEPDGSGIADPNRSLEESMKNIAGLVRETGAVIHCDHLPAVLGDETQLTHVFQNLLSNCLKYRTESGVPRIEISVRRTDSECVFRVADNGIGFEPQYAERIFGLFKRLHKDNYPGTGLGLAICRRIVERYGGRIWAESEGEGRGATVYFTARAAGE